MWSHLKVFRQVKLWHSNLKHIEPWLACFVIIFYSIKLWNSDIYYALVILSYEENWRLDTLFLRFYDTFFVWQQTLTVCHSGNATLPLKFIMIATHELSVSALLNWYLLGAKHNVSYINCITTMILPSVLFALTEQQLFFTARRKYEKKGKPIALWDSVTYRLLKIDVGEDISAKLMFSQYG